MERDTPTVKDIARALADRIATDVPVRDVIVNFRVRPQTTSGYKDRSSGGPLTTIARSVHAELYGLPNDPVEEPPTLAALLDAAHSQQPLAASRRPARTGCPAPPARRDPRPHDSLGEPTPRRPSRRGRVARGNRRRHPRRGDRTRTDPAHPRHPHSPAIVTAIQPQCGAGAGHRASPATPATCQRRDVRSETLTRLPRPTNPTITERTVFTDAHITFGTTADGGTLAVVAADLPPVHGILLAAGFAPDGHHGTFHYRLPPGPSLAAHLDTVAQVYAALLRYTPYIADLTSPQVHERDQPPPDPDVQIDLTSSPATATTRDPQAHEVLTRYGWAAAAGSANGANALPKETSATDTVAITVMTKHSLYAVGVSLAIALGIPATEHPRPAAGEVIRLPVPARTTGYRSR
ncbi:hypothetical protein OH787_06445 [Streptomyces sp. NBC_01547]|uniref:hypothetical protein n=1 Tax=Streptomyces sp. NBC_01547 TaxID=2975873 RepID=UPI003863BC6D